MGTQRGADRVAAPGTADADTAREKHAADILKRCTLFVRSLAYHVTSEQLSEKFSFIAPIKHATVVIDPSSKESRGFGFITFADADDAQRALKELNNAEFEGRKLKVELAEPRHRAAGASENTGTLPTAAAVPAKEKVKRRSPRLIIRNLPWSVQKPEQLIPYFQSFGKIKDVIIPKKRTGEMSGFAFVTMKGYKNAERAMEKVNGATIDGRVVAVDWAIEKAEWEAKTREQQVSEEATGVKAEEEQEMDHDDEEEEEEDNDDDEEGSGAEDEDMDDDEDEFDEDEDEEDRPPTDSSTTLFIRNLPYSATDDSVYEHFSQFGPVHYARIVMDKATARPKGTGFVCFYDPKVTNAVLRSAPRDTGTQTKADKPSLLTQESLDPDGKYTLDGRILSLSPAVDRNEAEKLSTASSKAREKTSTDKRRLYLVNEGMVPASSPLWKQLPSSERLLRDQSRDQRRQLLQADPNLHLSLTRLSVRNLPRWVTAKDLKLIARKAIPSFAEDLKAGLRTPLSREELARDGGEGKAAEDARRAKGVGVVKQAKVQLEKAGGRSRGYGFIEYWSHRYALMGLRYMNGQVIPGAPPANEESGPPRQRPAMADAEKKKHLIVEFAIENAKVINRRREYETRSREIGEKRRLEAAQSKNNPQGEKPGVATAINLNTKLNAKDFKKKDFGKKRKRDGDDGDEDKKKRKNWNQKTGKAEKKEDARPVVGEVPRMQEIIRKKRIARRAKKARK